MFTSALTSAGAEAETFGPLFNVIADDLVVRGYSINPGGLPTRLADVVWQHLKSIPESAFEEAGTGRRHGHAINNFVRKDSICWIDGSSEAGRQWLEWTTALQVHLNRQLYLGLFSFESHFAHYQPGDFYKRHLDAFRGEANRVLSLIVYLTPGWQPGDGGELVLYTDSKPQQDGECISGFPIGIRVQPLFGTVVTFLSEEFPHEVLPAERHRYSIAGWFRLNSSISAKADPPR